MDEHAVKLFKKRRAKRLADRGVPQFRETRALKKTTKPIVTPTYNVDDEEEERNVNQNVNENKNTGGGGHGNTRLPFGLCKRFGIEVDPSWQPRDAWDALAGKGITPSEAYRRLGRGEDPGVSEKSGESKKTPKKTTIEKNGKTMNLKAGHTSTGGYSVEMSYTDEKGMKQVYATAKFETKEDMLYYLKDNGVDHFQMEDGETVNPQEMELPKRVFSREINKWTGATEGFEGVGISLSKGKFVAFGQTFNGKKKPIETFNTMEEAEKYFTDRGVNPEDIKSSSTAKSGKGRGSKGPRWLHSEKKEYFEENGIKYGKTGLNRILGGCSLEAKDEQGHVYRKTFKTQTEAIRYLKDQGVEKTTLNGKEINPQEIEIPKTVATYKGTEYQDFEITAGASRVMQHIIDDYTPEKYVIALNARGVDLDGKPKTISVLPSMKREECTDENIRKAVEKASKDLGIDLSGYKMPKAADLCKEYDDKVAAEEKRVKDFIQWEKDHPKEAEERKRAIEWHRRTGKGYYSDG